MKRMLGLSQFLISTWSAINFVKDRFRMTKLPKLVLLGDTAVGKTSLARHWIKNCYCPNEPETIGCAFGQRELQLNGEVHILQIWDTGGHERYRSMTPMYARKAIGAFLVFDVSNRQTLDHITDWMKSLELCDPSVRVTVVGNKTDIEDREVSFAEGQALAQSLGYDYAETSAKTGAGVDDAFVSLAEKAIEAISVRTVSASSLPITWNQTEKRMNDGCC
jgi:small GTP-binding protein